MFSVYITFVSPMYSEIQRDVHLLECV